MQLNPFVVKVDKVGLRNSLSVWFLQNIMKKTEFQLQLGDLVKFIGKGYRSNSVIEAGINAIKEYAGYTHSNGEESVRKAVSRYWFGNEEKYNDIIITNGATGAAYLMAWAIKPEKVAIPCFSYPTWFTSTYKEGGEILTLERDEEGKISKHSIESINEDVDYVVIIPFDNPTGVVISKENILEIISRLKNIRKEYGKTIPLVMDMEYFDLVFNKSPEEVKNEYVGIGKEWIVVYTWSLSKSISGPEWRAGFLAVDYGKEYENEGMELINSLSIMNSDMLGINIASQFMIKQAMVDFLEQGETYKKREEVRKLVANRVKNNYKALESIKELNFMKKPECGFYCIGFVKENTPWKEEKLKERIWNKFRESAEKAGKIGIWKKWFMRKEVESYSLSELYALDLAMETKIIVVPYGRFNINEENEKIGFRVVIPHKEELIEKVVKAWEDFHKKRFEKKEVIEEYMSSKLLWKSNM